jgi:hypothetical protein
VTGAIETRNDMDVNLFVIDNIVYQKNDKLLNFNVRSDRLSRFPLLLWACRPLSALVGEDKSAIG